jgi:hypothetical protein
MDDMIGHMVNAKEGHEALHKHLRFGRHKVWMANGCAIWYPHLGIRGSQIKYHMRRRWVQLYDGKLTENITQGDCRHIVAWQSIPIAERYRIVLLAHDETVFIAREEDADEAAAFAVKCFSTSPPHAPDLPVSAEVVVDTCYGK